MLNSIDHIVFAGGGTAGHLFPGLAVAHELRRQHPTLEMTFVGTGKAFEAIHVRAAGFDYCPLPCRPFPRHPREALRFVSDNLVGYYAARRLLVERVASLVVGLGGYASVPTARAAARLGVPVVLLEQNAVPGRATRWLAPVADVVCSAFEGIRPWLKAGCRIRVTGNPLRREFVEQAGRARSLPDCSWGKRRLVVLGGSGGAQTLNEQVPLALYKAGQALADWRIVHQAGERQAATVAALYGRLGVEATVVPFIDDMPRLLHATNLVVSRSGGTTLAELAVTAVPGILLPLPGATSNHQRKNAEVFAAAGAARMIDERQLSDRLDNLLARSLSELADGHAERIRMAQAMTRLARPHSTRRVAQSISALLARRASAVA
jgi:UDP-N-acetylglucosamine--N-acetylmuramyl-(pentapeptide) pyrophosphoryl-undecaprenol N-acetylglucosamine transferase